MRIITVATLCAIGLLAALWLAPGVRPFDLGIIIRDPIVLRQMRHIVPAVLRAWRGDSPASAPSPGQRAVAPERLASRGSERVAAARTAAPRTPAPQSLALRTASAAQVDAADSPGTSIAMDTPGTATALPPDEPARPADEPEPKDIPAGAAVSPDPPANTSANSNSHRDRPANSGQGSKAGKDAGKDKNREDKEGRDTRRPDRDPPRPGRAAEEPKQAKDK